ncbi:hypothetical protein SAMN06265360_10295 [Haloechinothrix alba]|uniref:Uncharacterized protein n=1 Tax=Haloechinothrix alba TaxID=664784 RepID=A0A238VDN5_9PSEU|nr:hypothetical protein [Haloechinothrix alba]SNR32284.1 hypothetical protein SAMN06265360_10295 [Haloechinothrix alba]
MVTVARLVTSIDIDGDATSRTRMDVSACHEAELTDGRRIVLLDDHGWSGSIRDTTATIPDIWTSHSLEEICDTARMVVGPDEPPDDLSHEDMAAHHWTVLAGILRRHGIAADAAELRHLPHEVVPSARLLTRIGRTTQDTPPGGEPYNG